MAIALGLTEIKMALGSLEISKISLGEKAVYSAGNVVTYYMDKNVVYTEEIDHGDSCLSPATFKPTKSGWSFVGWREDTTANGSVLSNKTMGDDPITLYAVFCQEITLSYDGNGATSGSTVSESKTRFYNNKNVKNPIFKVKENGFTKTGHTFLYWTASDTTGAQYDPGESIELSQSTKLYVAWEPDEIVVYRQVIDGDVLIHNTNHVTLDDRCAQAGVWYRLAEVTTYNNISIDYGRYDQAVIDFEVRTNNVDAWTGLRTVDIFVQSHQIYNSRIHVAPLTYTLTTSAPLVKTTVTANNNEHDETWVHGWLYPVKITLTK